MASFEKKKDTQYPRVSDELDKCRKFLETFTEDFDQKSQPKYMKQLQEVANRQRKLIQVSLDDLADAFDPDTVHQIQRNTLRYEKLMATAADELMPKPNTDVEKDMEDIWHDHRVQRLTANKPNVPEADIRSAFPAELLRRFELRITPRQHEKISALREVKAKDIGSLVSIKGVITRMTDVLPMARVITYICSSCGYENYQTVNAKQFTPLQTCSSEKCVKDGNPGKLTQQTRGSKFVRYQSIRLQEMPEEVPVGHIPRSLTLKAFGELTRQCVPGDIVTVSGIFLPTPYQGYRAIRAGLTADVYLDVTSIHAHKKNYKDMSISEDVLEEVEMKAEEKDIFDQLAASVAPEIYGHEDIKKALILLLVGGVTRQLSDGMKIRGDINVLLMGDPGVAKSQLLKHIVSIAPRAVYTTGKGSSGVGLTAAVIKDPVTGEMSLEGGALVLADMGICCIDEFDKMEEGDRTAIHEVMEQQTVSIAKAGITTTLNARTAVLAAANPVFGRWNKRLSAEKNLGLPTALLSRFDLTFIILDQPNVSNDEALAQHVTYVHRESKHPPLEFEPFTPAFLRAYITRARQFNPYVPQELTDYIVGSYVGLRKESEEEEVDMRSRAATSQEKGSRQAFCTPRSLLSILRLSQGLARLHFRDQVEKEDVEEAMRLLYVAKASTLLNDDDDKKKSKDPKSEIYKIIRRFARDNRTTEVALSDIRPKIVRLGYKDEQIETTLREYEELSVWSLSRDRETIKFMSAPK